MNALAQIETHYSNLVDLHAPIYNVAGKKQKNLWILNLKYIKVEMR